MQHTLILPDGSKISSGAPGTAIRSVKLSRSVNPEPYLSPGGVTAARLEIELFDPKGLTLAAGDPVTLVGEGVFYLEEPRRSGKLLQLTGCDCITRLDTDLTAWLNSLEGWPYPLKDFAAMVCTACGLTLEAADIPNSDYPVQPFRGTGITGRQLMKWAGEAACRFLVATGESTVALRWYTDSGIALGATGEHFFYRDSLSTGEPLAAPGKVVIRATERDVGVSAGTGENTLYITGNLLLSGAKKANAAAIAGALSGLSYTPLTVETPVAIAPGDIFTANGKRSLAMAVEATGGRCRITAAQAPAAQSKTLSQYRALSGRTMELSAELEGLSARLSQTQGLAEQAAAVSLEVDALSARVTATEAQADLLHTKSTALTQRADSLEVAVQTQTTALDTKAEASELEAMAEHFLFDADGLTISNSASGMGIGVSQERVVFTGGSDPTTVILPNAMHTTNLRVGSRLDIGNFALLPRTNGNLSLRYVGG